jgi:hypothetical protein
MGPRPARVSQSLMLGVRASAVLDGRLVALAGGCGGPCPSGTAPPHGADLLRPADGLTLDRRHRPPDRNHRMSAVTVPETFQLRQRAERLASALPPMLVAAERIANAVIHGLHGRRRSGPGEDFWQYRSYSFGDSVQSIDWRKSSRSDRVLVRENEWAASHTIWLWASQAPGMEFHSHLANTTKRDRAVLLALALSVLATKAGERVGAIGSPHRPGHTGATLNRMAEWYACRRRRPGAAAGNAAAALLRRRAGRRFPRTARRDHAPVLDPGGQRRGRACGAGARSGRRNAALSGPHRISGVRRRRPADGGSGRDVCASATRRGSRNSARACATSPGGSAGPSRCTPPDARHSRCCSRSTAFSWPGGRTPGPTPAWEREAGCWVWERSHSQPPSRSARSPCCR